MCHAAAGYVTDIACDQTEVVHPRGRGQGSVSLVLVPDAEQTGPFGDDGAVDGEKSRAVGCLQRRRCRPRVWRRGRDRSGACARRLGVFRRTSWRRSLTRQSGRSRTTPERSHCRRGGVRAARSRRGGRSRSGVRAAGGGPLSRSQTPASARSHNICLKLRGGRGAAWLGVDLGVDREKA